MCVLDCMMNPITFCRNRYIERNIVIFIIYFFKSPPGWTLACSLLSNFLFSLCQRLGASHALKGMRENASIVPVAS